MSRPYLVLSLCVLLGLAACESPKKAASPGAEPETGGTQEPAPAAADAASLALTKPPAEAPDAGAADGPIAVEEPAVAGESSFRVAAVADLGLPLQQAFEAARAQGGSFRIVFAAGNYSAFALSLRDSNKPSTLELVLEGEGAEPVVLDGVSLALAAKAVTLRGLVLQNVRLPAPTLDVAVVERFVAERFAILDSRREEASGTEPLVAIAASGPKGTTATATLRECSFVGNQVEGSAPILATPKSGKSYLSELRLEGVVFVANEAAAGVEPWFTRALVVERGLVVEDKLARGWLSLQSPLVRVSLADSVLSSSSPLVELVTGPDVALLDFAPVEAKRCELRQPGAPDPSRIAASECSNAAAYARPSSRSPLDEAAKLGSTVDPKALVAALGL